MELENKVPEQINDIKKENFEKLAQLFPSIIKDGQVDFKALKEELGEFEEVKEERYEFTWAGKQNAKKKVQEDIGARTLKYIEEDSKNPDTTENLYIEGDNLEVLKLLRQNYYGSIKMIYIDPPYNTGKDFIYKDNFSQKGIESDIQEGSRDEEGNRLEINNKSSNRYHANWLNMMYPRLKVARDLLTDEGVIFISIDDNEQKNLREICDEIFGEENFIGLITIQSNPRGSQASKLLSNVHEYLLVFSKNKEQVKIKGIMKNENDLLEYSLKDENGEYYRLLGLRQRGGAWKKEDRPLMHYPIYINPDNLTISLEKSEKYKIEVIPKRPTGELSRWTWGKEKIQKEIDKIIPKKVNRTNEEETWDIFRKDYLKDEEGNEKTTKVKTIWIEKETNYQNAKNELKKLFANSEYFDFPKPCFIIKRIIEMFFYSEQDIILDFFSGSATTAHAVMQLNAEDGGNRKYIMVQLPEEVDEKSEAYKFLKENNKPTNICEIGKERIRRAGELIKKEIEESNKQLQLGEEPKKVPDIGFKVFRTADTNINWKKIREVSKDNVMKFDDPDMLDFTLGFNDKDVVYEVLLRQRDLPLSEKLVTLTDIGSRTYLYADSYLVCLETNVTEELIEKLAELNPLPIKFIFRDSAFGSKIGLKEETFRKLKTLVEKNSGLTKKAYTVEFI